MSLPLPAARDEKQAERAGRRAASAELLARIQAGGGEALRHQMARLWMKEVLRWCRWLCTRRLDPEDLAQEVLMTLIADVHKVREGDRVEAWLREVAWRKIRAQERRAWFRFFEASERPELADEAPGADAELSRRQSDALTRRILEEMSLEDRQLLWMHYIEGLERREVAEQLGLSEGTLNRKMTLARQDFERRARRRGLGPEGEP